MTVEQAAAPPTLHKRQIVGFGAGNFSVNLIAQTFATLAVFYYDDQLKASPSLIALAMAIHGVFNAVLNPLFGHLSDRTRSRWGRRVPYILFGMVPLAAAFTLIWTPPVSGSSSLFWYFLLVVLVYDVLFVLVVLNYGAIFPEMFVTRAERAAGAAWRQMFAIVGMILGVGAAPVLYGALGWSGMGIVLAVLTVLGFTVALTGSVERRQSETAPFSFFAAIRHTFANRAFLVYVIGSFLLQLCVALLQASIAFFAKYVLGNPSATMVSLLLGTIFVVAVPMVYVWGAVIRRFGAKKAILATVAVYLLASAPFLLVSDLVSALLTAAATGIAVAGMLVLLDILLAEVIDVDAARTGVRREGMYLGVNGFIVRWSVSVQALIMGFVLPRSGYDASLAVQPHTVQTGVRLLIGGIPMGILVLAFLMFLAYPSREKALS
ncbi:MFS transporter [Amycolatopsis alkalitolerans]|uniref:MFS transporter n=1 Tax=Amycolatopsis alkalitolerans TaxID=2547244 RepID=A0A5C4LTA3_9PSEU|nr:MFS transporter [Amycolatopsis alkalitolerans]TNC21009.1 MFS transporter [Amycolatopsis alkalitolerans]